MENTVLCVRWGDKYDDTYVKKLKEQLDKHLTVPFNFYCLTDNPKEEYDIQLPTEWDKHYRAEKNMFWAYRKCYMFNEQKYFPQIKGVNFLYFDIDILIHNNIDCMFELDMKRPYIVRGWWNDAENCRKNFGLLKSKDITGDDNNSSPAVPNGDINDLYNPPFNVKSRQILLLKGTTRLIGILYIYNISVLNIYYSIVKKFFK